MNIGKFTRDIYEEEIAGAAQREIEALIQRYASDLAQAKDRFVQGRSGALKSSEVDSQALNKRSEVGLPWDETDVFLICYGDSILPDTLQNAGLSPAESALGVGGGIEDDGTVLPAVPAEKQTLSALRSFAQNYLKGVVSGIHILPFFPYSSDDGFSIVDYFEVNPLMGDWEQIRALAQDFRFMADLVLNHCSVKGPWFKGFLYGQHEFENYFIHVEDANADLSAVVRPRTHPLLTEFDRIWADSVRVWTTFSEDQVDLNFEEPAVLVRMLEALLFFIVNGAQVIRLDAIAYLWKELGTTCIHHPKTHRVVQLFRHVLDSVAPWVILITETNVPHAENVSYFGNGTNEAHMIYQFSLPPLLLDAFLRGNAEHLSDWARSIPSGVPGEVGYNSTYFNFCASHDGIGLTPAHGILSEDELESLCHAVQERGGRINYKNTAGGKIPYELNINYLSAIAETTLPVPLRIKKFIASQAVLLSLVGIPGIYIHSLLGSENWQEGVELTGANRSINRQKLFLSEVEADLAGLSSSLRAEEQTGAENTNADTASAQASAAASSLRAGVYAAYTALIRVRKEHSAFHPAGRQTVLNSGQKEVFAILREAPEFDGSGAAAAQVSPRGAQRVLCLINTAQALVNVDLLPLLSERETRDAYTSVYTLKNIINGQNLEINTENSTVTLDSWDILYLAL